MSKKNNLKIRARQHEFDLRREQEAQRKRQEKALKKRENRPVGVRKPLAKRKAIRLRKGKHVKVTTVPNDKPHLRAKLWIARVSQTLDLRNLGHSPMSLPNAVKHELRMLACSADH